MQVLPTYKFSIHTIPYILQGSIVRTRPTIAKIIVVTRRAAEDSISIMTVVTI